MRQYMIILVILLLYGCSGKYNQGPSGIIRDLSSYFGGVAADEAHASLVGHDILSAGGTSADAAVAMAFALWSVDQMLLGQAEVVFACIIIALKIKQIVWNFFREILIKRRQEVIVLR